VFPLVAITDNEASPVELRVAISVLFASKFWNKTSSSGLPLFQPCVNLRLQARNPGLLA
jgi:hypothetical protein